MKIGEGVAVLISGRGSNLEAILKSPMGGEVAAVVSDNPDAPGLQIAEQWNKPAFVVAEGDFESAAAMEDKTAELLQAVAPKIIALAGYMRILSPRFVAAFAGRAVNLHPSLLPNFPGLQTHARALAAGAKEHGCTVHWLSDKVDGGDIIAQKKVAVHSDDNEETLAARVLAAEHQLYPQTLARLLKGELK